METAQMSITGKRIHRRSYIHTVEYYSAIRISNCCVQHMSEPQNNCAEWRGQSEKEFVLNNSLYIKDTDYNPRGQKADWWVSGGQGLRGISGSGLGGVKHSGEQRNFLEWWICSFSSWWWWFHGLVYLYQNLSTHVVYVCAVRYSY